MALIRGLYSTTVWKAFFLNSLVSTLVVIIAITVKSSMDKYTGVKTEKGKNAHITEISRSTSAAGIVVTIIATFCASMLGYTLMHIVFGYGGGQLASREYVLKDQES